MNIFQETFTKAHIIDLLILYKQLNPTKNVYLSEKSIKDAIMFMDTTGKSFANELGIS